MNWKYHAITLATFVAAIYTYVSAPVVGGVLMGAGIVLEGIFWTRLFKRTRNKKA